MPALLALTATVGLSACNNPSNAAVVDGEAITTDQAQTVAREYNEIAESNGGASATPDKTLAVFIEGHFALQEQSDAGHGISSTDARRIVQENLRMKHTSDTLVEFYRRVIAIETVRQDPAAYKKLEKKIKAADITINPRYGQKFDVAKRAVTNAAPAWIKPFEAPKAKAAGQPPTNSN